MQLPEMTEEKARLILGDLIQADSSLQSNVEYVRWSPGDANVMLDCSIDGLSVEQLLAIAWWMTNKKA